MGLQHKLDFLLRLEPAKMEVECSGRVMQRKSQQPWDSMAPHTASVGWATQAADRLVACTTVKTHQPNPEKCAKSYCQSITLRSSSSVTIGKMRFIKPRRTIGREWPTAKRQGNSQTIGCRCALVSQRHRPFRPLHPPPPRHHHGRPSAFYNLSHLETI